MTQNLVDDVVEVELKLIAQGDALSGFQQHVLTQYEGRYELRQATLKNQYFDTPDQMLRKHKMGLRVRSNNQHHEQTLKQKGKVVGGLHQRPEYNIDVPTANVDVRLFPEDIWPPEFDVPAIQDQLKPLFTTHFHRTTYILTDHADNVFEVVFDVGDVSTEKDQRPINEVELELKQGNPIAMFDLALEIGKHSKVRVNDLTKAAFGYALANGKHIKSKHLPYILSLERNCSTEAAFTAAVQSALSHWQYHQSVYMETYKLAALTEMVRAIRMLLQAFSLYLPVLQCKELLTLHKQLIVLSQKWDWQNEIQAIRYLRSPRGPFSKRLNRDQALMSYLQGRKEGILNAQDPESLIFSTLSTQIQLNTAALLLARPWRTTSTAFDAPVSEHANGWLSQGWQTVLQAFPGKALSVSQYLSAEAVLRQILRNGYMLASLFSEDREAFRAPWIDLALGLEELNALVLLESVLAETDFDDKHELQQWTKDKITALLRVMEMTRSMAMRAETYW